MVQNDILFQKWSKFSDTVTSNEFDVDNCIIMVAIVRRLYRALYYAVYISLYRAFLYGWAGSS